MKVILRDVNDNAPVLAAVGDIALPAGSSRRTIARVNGIFFKAAYLSSFFLLCCIKQEKL